MKNTTHLYITAIAVTVLVCGFGGFLMKMNYRNRAAALEASAQAKQLANTVDFDAMWKIIDQVAQVPGEYSSAFKEAYSAMIASGGNTSNNSVKGLFAVALGMKPPELDSSVYKKVQDTIIAERTKFARNQVDLLAIAQEYKTLITTFPGTVFLGDKKEIKTKLVTSSKTDKAFETGRDEETRVFK